MEESYFGIPKSVEYLQMASQVGAFIHELPLNVEQNDKLIQLVVENMEVGRVDAFRYGMDLGIKLGKTVDAENMKGE